MIAGACECLLVTSYLFRSLVSNTHSVQETSHFWYVSLCQAQDTPPHNGENTRTLRLTLAWKKTWNVCPSTKNIMSFEQDPGPTNVSTVRVTGFGSIPRSSADMERRTRPGTRDHNGTLIDSWMPRKSTEIWFDKVCEKLESELALVIQTSYLIWADGSCAGICKIAY